MKELEFSEIKEGMRVEDNYGNISIVKKCKDKLIVLVQFEFLGTVGGYGFYCLDREDKLHYDPLYEKK